MHTYTRYNEDTRHTWPITVDGAVRWADTDKAIELAYSRKPINTAMYKDGLGGFRGFALHLYQGTFYTVSNDGTITDKHIQQGWAAFDRYIEQYDADPRWTRMEGVNQNGIEN